MGVRRKRRASKFFVYTSIHTSSSFGLLEMKGAETMGGAINVIRFCERATLPEFKTSGAAGFDLASAFDFKVKIDPGESIEIPTGLGFEIPRGYAMFIRGRSSLAFKHGVIAFEGTIDADYRGEVKVKLFNCGAFDFVINPTDRIAQGVIVPVLNAQMKTRLTLVDGFKTTTERGERGFGSTGRNG